MKAVCVLAFCGLIIVLAVVAEIARIEKEGI